MQLLLLLFLYSISLYSMEHFPSSVESSQDPLIHTTFVLIHMDFVNNSISLLGIHPTLNNVKKLHERMILVVFKDSKMLLYRYKNNTFSDAIDASQEVKSILNIKISKTTKQIDTWERTIGVRSTTFINTDLIAEDLKQIILQNKEKLSYSPE